MLDPLLSLVLSALALPSLGPGGSLLLNPEAQMAPRRHNPDYVVRVALPPRRPAVDLPPVLGPDDASRPLVVIDAGHGGYDPGASGGDGQIEKQLTLNLALALRDELLKRARVRVALTRSDDRFLVLDERSGIARRLHADLFISIHADAAQSDGATGATLYTLSETASDKTAEAIASRENSADTINGVQLRKQAGTVDAILVDLSRREALERAAKFAGLVRREASGGLHFRAEAVKSAAFVVLKAPDVPSVLFESGYISNSADAAFLGSPQGREAFAETFARAIEAYFVRVRPGR
ncbi:N-acetylmuramoyl-L-alanine amidase [Novosphingobium tardum]|uniref:N-acetylmuramoyl-L-alanine amidase n=1 Tax=Novosphingobium tardum TaxID=1538021 RepID=A0ABV8RTH8_9SPHN